MYFQERGLGGQGVLRDGCVFSLEGFGWARGFEGWLCVFIRGVWVGRGFEGWLCVFSKGVWVGRGFEGQLCLQ